MRALSSANKNQGVAEVDLRRNRIKHRLAEGETALVAGGISHADDVEAVGYTLKQQGFDGIWLEGEHGWVTDAELGNLTRACDILGLTSVARVNANSQSLIYRTLDRGAQAIAVPHVNTRAEAENVVEGGKFAPVGKRGMFVSRQGFGVSDYFNRANDETLLVILVEDIVAVQNLDEILKVDHIDVFFVAPSDLSASMGRLDGGQGAETQRLIKDTLKKITDAGRVAGTMVNNENVEMFAEAGARFFFTVVGPWIAQGAKEFAKRAAAGAGK